MHSLDNQSLRNIIEASLLGAGKALSLQQLQNLFIESETPSKQRLQEQLQQLATDYQNRGVEVIEVASGWRIQVCKTYAPWVSRLWEEKPQRYSRALLETLSLVAYRQPITRGEIEDIRGVSVSSHIIKTLLEREWIRVIGHRDVAGRPALFATTKPFLDYFGLKSLNELPTLAEIRDLDEIDRELRAPTESNQTDALQKRENKETNQETITPKETNNEINNETTHEE
jgi:segregation and condensation protein B